MKTNFKKDLASNIVLICVLAFSGIHLLLITLNLFNVTHFALPTNFSYITAYILMIICFCLYILGFWIERLKNLKIPTWFKMTFYISFFLFTNVYYILGLYYNLFFSLVFVACLALFFNICGLSVYFNMTKDDKNKLKASTKELIFNSTAYSIVLCALSLFVISTMKVLFCSTFVFSSLTSFVFEMLTMLVTTAIVATIFAISHRKKKIVINNCLIKIIPKTISPSIKQQ